MLQPLFLLIILIFLNAVWQGAEIAVISANQMKIKDMADEENKKAKRLLKLTENPARFLATIQVAITFAGFLQSAFAAESFAEPFVNWLITLGISLPHNVLKFVSIVIITLILAYFNLVFGELVPKRIAMKNSEKLALSMSAALHIMSVFFAPIVWILTLSTNLILKLFGLNPDEEEDKVTEEEIIMMLREGGEQGTILEAENEIIQNVFEFNDTIVKDIATHRVNVDILWLEDDNGIWAQTIHETRHTRYPVCDKSADDVVGILNAKDYFRLDDKSRESILENAVSPAYFVPETITADVLFRNMKQTRNPMAVIIDEQGGMEGIITIYDLVEELVGELNEAEESSDEPAITKLGEKEWRISGNISLEDLQDATGIEFDDDEYETLTGLAFDVLGIIPSDGECEIKVSLPQMEVLIKQINAHQIDDAVITIK